MAFRGDLLRLWPGETGWGKGKLNEDRGRCWLESAAGYGGAGRRRPGGSGGMSEQGAAIVGNGGTAMGPDIVFFMMDQLAAKWLEAARAGAARVPNFERLAGMGTNFRRCISSNPLCCPARATLATGLSTRGHGVLQNGYYLDGSIPTFMRALQEAGYRTAALGRVHFDPHYASLDPDYRPYGFDVQHITEDGRGGGVAELDSERASGSGQGGVQHGVGKGNPGVC